MIGVRLFLSKLKRLPGRALAGLALDYATYVGMCLFFVCLWVLRGPLGLLGRQSRRAVSRTLIDAVAKVAHG